ncbi:HET-domain-containing protein, partial [Trematosphaeria pertusa]
MDQERREVALRFGIPTTAPFPLPRLASDTWRVEYVHNVASQPDYSLIKGWIRQCSDAHSSCESRNCPELRKARMVDVEHRVITSLPDDCEYFALSYVWGGVQQQSGPPAGPLPDQLGLTIEHAITVVRNLGYRYLWVDSLCIDQCNPDEKHDQIGLMHRIYHSAFATIIVLDSPNANSGIPGVGSSRNASQIWAQFGNNQILSKCPSMSSELGRSVWATRAWTYQEGLLSRKRLVFTNNQVHFVCN